MKRPPLGPGGEDITRPDQVAIAAEEHLVPAKSNLKPQTSRSDFRSRAMLLQIAYAPIFAMH